MTQERDEICLAELDQVHEPLVFCRHTPLAFAAQDVKARSDLRFQALGRVLVGFIVGLLHGEKACYGLIPVR